MSGPRVCILAVPGVLLLSAILYFLSPPPAPGAGDVILDRAARILGVSTPGEGAGVFPSSSAWPAYLTAGIQELLFRLSDGGNRALFVQSHHEPWMSMLRGIWALLSALLVAGGVRLAASWAPSGSPGRAAGRAFAGAILLASPLLPIGIRELAPFVPAGLVFLWIAESAVLSRRGGLPTGIGMGLILAWYPFLWTLIPIVLLLCAMRRLSSSRLVGMFGLAVFLGLILEPRHLMELGSLPAVWIGEWKRGGGWGGPGGAGLPAQLTLSSLMGPGAFALWIAGWWRLRRTWRDAPALLAAGAWAGLVLLPALSGARSPGSAQFATCAFLAVWAGVALGSLPGHRVPVWLPWVLGVGVLALMAPARTGFERAARESVSIREAVAKDLESLIGDGGLWLSDSAILQRGATRTSPGYARLGFVLPRDSRDQSRYDYAYWPRWYPGFRWVLLSSSRVRENVSRSGADLPRSFYRLLHHSGDLVRSWGSGEREGYRLYRIREDSRWTRALTEGEFAGLRGDGGTMTWFLGNLGTLYMNAGDLDAAALLLRQGIEWDPESVSLYNNLGAVYLREGEFELAAAAFEEGLRMAPESFELLYNFALACVSHGLHDRAERLLLRVLAARPGYAPAHFELARIFRIRGRHDLEREALRRFLELDTGTPGRADALHRLGVLSGGEDGGAQPGGGPGLEGSGETMHSGGRETGAGN